MATTIKGSGSTKPVKGENLKDYAAQLKKLIDEHNPKPKKVK